MELLSHNQGAFHIVMQILPPLEFPKVLVIGIIDICKLAEVVAPASLENNTIFISFVYCLLFLYFICAYLTRRKNNAK